MRILIRAFTLKRDVLAAQILAELFQRKRWSTAVVSVKDFPARLKLWRPDVVVVNTVGVIRYVKDIHPTAFIVFFDGEGGETFRSSSAKLFLDTPDLIEAVDLVLVWGQEPRNYYLRNFNNDVAEKVLEIGNPRLDILKINLGKSVQNQTIGVLTRFNSINQFDGRPAAYTLTNQKNERTLGNVLDQVTAFFHFYKGILALLEYTDHHINIRSYPLENPRFYETIFKQQIADGRVDVDDQLDYGSWLKGQSLILTLSSTAFLEAYLTKTPIILLDRFCGVEERNRRLDKVTGLAFSVASIPATVAELVEMVMSPKRIRRHADIDKYLRDFHNWDKEVSVIANARDSILEKFSEKSERSIRLRVPEYLLSILEYGKFFQERRRGRLNPLNYTRFKHGSAYDVPKLVNQLEALQTNGQ